ncbi:hypothetical protein LWC34_53485 [Kibdelosporangium philippinense]|uniref:Uncharacterized protein n=1 Tax=Kibdelosporangium philippinense TaxID=211113 RepID=A0ABS8ZV41_9PSEU|nr:hypothetical protein [Kibdelosporangium philippinense]MCE7011571.1 hypothetical protein [Kibdelosporangium philippinense]
MRSSASTGDRALSFVILPFAVERLGYWLKSSAVVIAMINCVLLGEQLAPPSDPFWPVIIASAGVILVLLYFGYRLEAPVPPIRKQIRTHPGVRDYAPIPGEGWLPHEVWREFPDPVPEVPAVQVSFYHDIPAGDVPPDATLRRLWLVRAQIAAEFNVYRAFSRHDTRSPFPTIKLGSCGSSAPPCFPSAKAKKPWAHDLPVSS